MASKKVISFCFLVVMIGVAALTASAQSFRVQCPADTITHPAVLDNVNAEPAYNGPTVVPFAAISSISSAGNSFNVTVTLASPVPSGLANGLTVAIVGVTPAAFNGSYTISAVNGSGFHYTATTRGLGTGTGGYVTTNKNGAIKCQQISGGDGYSTMADGTQTYMFAFGPLSGLADIAGGRPGTEFPKDFNTVYPGTLTRGDPATSDGATSGAVPGVGVASGTVTPPFTYNGAVGLTGDENVSVGQAGGARATVLAADLIAGQVTNITVTNPGTGCALSGGVFVGGLYTGPPDVTIAPPSGYPTRSGTTQALATATVSGGCIQLITVNYTGSEYTSPPAVTIGPAGNECLSANPPAACLDGHVDPRPIIDVGVMNGNIPAPLFAFDEDDEFFLTLTNVGMIMRPDLFEQHTVHFHGYPNASSFYDGVPDASVAINIGGSFTYYYLAPDAGTYFWHCHITPPEHLQMGMVGQLYVRPRQDRVPSGQSLYTYLGYQNGIGVANPDLRTACKPSVDILCSASTPAVNTGATRAVAGSLCNNPATSVSSNVTPNYVYNDGDGSTCYDVEYPIQMHGFDPNFHFVGMTFNPEMFADMNDKYFLLNGRSYPDTVGACGGVVVECVPGPQATVSSDSQMHYSQPLPALINIPAGGKASLRLVNLSVAEYFTLQTLGIPMHVVGWNAKLLRDQAGNNTEYWANSITLGGGESNDVILDASDAGCSATLGAGCAAKLYPAGSVFYLYEPDLYRLSNDAENFGGMMTEVHICNSVTSSTFGNTCN